MIYLREAKKWKVKQQKWWCCMLVEESVVKMSREEVKYQK
jgi:hypothetical protein